MFSLVIKIFFYCCFFSFLFTSCLKDNNLKIVELTKSTVDSVDLASFTEFVDISSAFQPLFKDYVYFYVSENGALFKLDLVSFELYKINTFYKSNIVNFEINDSLKILSLFSDDSLFSYKFDGSLLRSLEIPSTNDEYLFVGINEFRPLMLNNDNFLINLFYITTNAYIDKNFFSQPIECNWNTSNNKITKLNIYYPANYMENSVGINFTPQRIQISNRKLAYSFSYNDSIFIYDMINKTTDKFFFGSHRGFKGSTIPFDSINNYNEAVFDKMYLENPSYFYTRYLSNKELFCRLLITTKVENDKKIRKWRLVFANKNFKYIGETDEIDFGLNLFDTKDKLYTIKINPQTNHLVCSEIITSF